MMELDQNICFKIINPLENLDISKVKQIDVLNLCYFY